MISTRVLICAALLCASTTAVIGQSSPFTRLNIPVTENGSLIRNPDAGGLDLPQFSEIDLNNDAIKDLFVFDRAGNKALTFINGGTAGQADYTYAPQYLDAFPADLKDYVLLADYDCDGKEDIFTSKSSFGMRVFRNTSSGGNLSFALAFDTLMTDLGAGKTAIIVNTKDLPAIADIDGDGDLDVLTFDGSGTHLEWHSNQAMETTGNCAGLDLRLVDACWGKFEESGTNQVIALNISCRYSPHAQGDPLDSRHSGSTVLTYDEDADGDMEVIIGDLIYDGLTYLHNAGTNVSGHIDSVDATWPSDNVSARLNIFPGAFYFDADNDGKKDIIAAPNAVNIGINYNNAWLYRNVAPGPGFVPEYETNRFLVGTMIDCGTASQPAFFDHDGDGDQDLVVGNYRLNLSPSNNKSVLTFYENVGTANAPSFQLVSRNYAGLAGLFSPALDAISPTFGDLDGDGDPDMIIGKNDGKIHYFTNIAGVGQAANFVLSQSDFGWLDAGLNSAPFLVDWDRNGTLDLIIGEQSGRLKYYRNIGTSTVPAFPSTPTIDNFGGIDVHPNCCVGNSVPFVFTNPTTGHYDLVIGSDTAGLWYIPSADTMTGNFVLGTRDFGGISEGQRTAAAGTDLDGDGVIDFAVGNLRGGIAFYKGDFVLGQAPAAPVLADLQVYPNPSTGDLNVSVRTHAPASVRLHVYDLHGRALAHADGRSNGAPIDVPTLALPAGVYAVAIDINGKPAGVKRWVLMR